MLQDKYSCVKLDQKFAVTLNPIVLLAVAN
jgi:hypothetical protein